MKSNRIKTVFLFIMGCVPAMGVQGWRAVYYDTDVVRTHYDIRESSMKRNFHRYELDGIVSSDENGICMLTYGKVDKRIPDSLGIPKKAHYFFDETDAFYIKKDTTVFEFECYQENVQSYTVYLEATNGKWYKKTFENECDGYLCPQRIALSDWLDNPEQETAKISRLFIVAEPRDIHIGIKFVTARLVISDEVKVEQICQHPFFDKLFGKPGNCDTLITGNALLFSDKKGSALFCTKDTYGMQCMSNYFEFKNDSGEKEVPFIKKLIRLIIEEYPFYQERKIDKQAVAKKLNNFFMSMSDTASVQLFIDSLAGLINKEFKDAHFFIEPPAGYKHKKLIFGPVRLYEIENKIVVAAVFDSLYADIKLGTEVVAIDNKPVSDLVDSLAPLQLGQPGRQRMKAVSLLLCRNESDSAVITYCDAAGLVDRTIYYDRKVTIPSGFKPAHGLYEWTDSVAYYKMGQMDDRIFPGFFNKIKQIRKAKGLILDIRGNPGGSSAVGEKIFSLFIERPMVYHHTTVSGKTDRLETRIIRPDKKNHFSARYPVVIIGDENTACASEDFIQAMKQLNTCYFLSYSRTIGFLHNRYGVRFPSGAFLSIDCLSDKIVSNEAGVVECKGIEPNVWLQPTCVSDLAPYDDLLKNAAKKIITSKFW